MLCDQTDAGARDWEDSASSKNRAEYQTEPQYRYSTASPITVAELPEASARGLSAAESAPAKSKLEK